MQAVKQKQLDLEILPVEARKELLDFYEYLMNKYGYSPQKRMHRNMEVLDILPKPVKKFRPLKREEIYAR